ncbi:hypothetical protein [Paenibacillus nasutitermitis]|uniref:Uncharacterized protein n=1 Tax=Paenibacillus nasutitermitis TaxID=1652958 RepID=A0A916ZIX6_9BACL|nr:hypothetical protein [Paenibacillus nasutitermitis]GGD99855.1 hypothetical protein GCM10010911_68490 [Paenibacillus nasutitermitis]
MSKIKIQLVPDNFEEVLEQITDSGQAVLTSPVESETELEELRKSIQDHTQGQGI